MGTIKDLTGKQFGRLTVIKCLGRINERIHWLCQCSCGNKTVLPTVHLTRTTEPVRSCGCLGVEARKAATTKHGQRQNRIYYTWQNMIRRCIDPSLAQYKDYGGRGICVCEEWHDFIPFWEWSKKSGYTDELTLDRIDVNGNYCPENCRWTTTKVQNNNRTNNDYITYKGITKTRQEWAETLNINVDHFRVLLRKYDRDLTFIIDYMITNGYKQQKYQHLTKWTNMYKEYKKSSIIK